nr:hypothetical protein [uncultured Psychroserpens sp.]
MSNNILNNVQKLVASDKTDQALKLLQNNSFFILNFNLTILRNRYFRLKKNINRGTITHDKANIELNRINKSILSLAVENEKPWFYRRAFLRAFIVILLLLVLIIVFKIVSESLNY